MTTRVQPRARILGVDPGLNLTGYGVVDYGFDEVRLVEAGVIRLPRSHNNNLPARLESLFKELREVMKEFRPRTVCLED